MESDPAKPPPVVKPQPKWPSLRQREDESDQLFAIRTHIELRKYRNERTRLLKEAASRSEDWALHERYRTKLYSRSDKGVWAIYTGRARRAKTEWTLPQEDFFILINSKCEYCDKPNCRGVDRVDNSKGYLPENSVPCCTMCNVAKNKHSMELWTTWRLAIAANMAKKNL